ncbi:MAG TPA: hypothetical protein QF764_00755 [Planctomycetota bacterium]|jgi:hypothetical protein|nr:hypothetical protein [Planctomycetota bacterium]
MDSALPITVRRPAVLLLILSSAGLAGLLPSRAGDLDPVALLAWLALVSTGLGILAGAWLPRVTALLVLLPWWAAVHGIGLNSGLPDPSGAWWAVAGLFTLGWGVGLVCRRSAMRAAGAAFLLCGLLTALPGGGGELARPWSPPVAARLLDLSPVAVVLECGGLDFMRHPEVYGPAGTMDFGPELRSAWRAPGAAVPLLLLGLAFAGLAFLRAPR